MRNVTKLVIYKLSLLFIDNEHKRVLSFFQKRSRNDDRILKMIQGVIIMWNINKVCYFWLTNLINVQLNNNYITEGQTQNQYGSQTRHTFVCAYSPPHF